MGRAQLLDQQPPAQEVQNKCEKTESVQCTEAKHTLLLFCGGVVAVIIQKQKVGQHFTYKILHFIGFSFGLR